jgi:hypothetical protein
MIRELSPEQLERAAEVFIHEGTSFAISQGDLWMSKASVEVLQKRRAYIMTGP